MKQFSFFRILLPLLLITACIASYGQVSITTVGSVYNQDFTSLGTSATATLPQGFVVNTTANWSTGTTATTQAFGTTGTGIVTSSSSGIVNWANGVTGTSTERALGFLGSGTITSPRYILFAFTNNTGQTVGSLSISFDYEKYRSGSRAWDMNFFHGATATAVTTAATAGDQTYAADANNTTVNNPPTTISKSFNLTGLSIVNGTTYYLAWRYQGNGGSTNAQGLGLDNFSLTAYYQTPTTSQITPSSATAGGSAFTITVDGTNFIPGTSFITWNGSTTGVTMTGTPTTTQLQATINASLIASQGSANVGVTTTGALNTSNTQAFTINAGGGAQSQTISFSPIATKIYGDVPFDPGATATSGLAVSYSSSNTSVATVSGNMITIVGAGTSTITASQGGGTNGGNTYNAAPDVTQTLTVNPKTLTVSNAVAQNKLYDGTTAAVITGGTLVGVINSDNVTIATSTGTFSSSAVGTWPVTAALTLGGTKASNYTLQQPTGLSATISNPILAWDFAGQTTTPATTVNATTVDVNLNSSTVSRGAGLVASGLTDAYSSSDFAATSFATAVTANDYYQFTISAKPGYQVSLSSLNANFRRSSSGPTTFQWQYSLDGFATAGIDIGSPITYNLSGTNGDQQAQIDLSSIGALQNISTIQTVAIRLYGWNGATGGTFGFGRPTSPPNDIAIGGTVTVAPKPDITVTAAHPTANNVDQGTVDAQIGGFFVNVATANAYLLGLSVTTAGTYLASDITNIKFWVNGTPTLSGATQLGTTQAAVGSGGTASISGLSYTIPPGSSRYIFVTATIASGAVPGHTIKVAATPYSNFNFASSNNAGASSVAAGNDQTITQLDPTIALSNASPVASTFSQNATNQIIHSIKLDITTTSATLTGVTMTPTGSYQTADLVANSFKFWINTSNTLTGATLLGSAQPIVASGNAVLVSGLSQALSNNTTYYILFTTDVSYNAVAGRTIEVGAINFGDITFVSGNNTGTNPISGGNTRTFAAVVPNITLAGGGPSGNATFGAPSTANTIYQFNLATANNAAVLTQVKLNVGGTVVFSDFVTGGVKLFYNTVNTLGTATQISATNMVTTGSQITFSGLNQVIPSGSTGFFWVTGDISATATSGHTVTISLTNANLTFTQGTKTGTATASGTFSLLTQPTITEIIMPQYMQGASGTNNNRTPYLFRAKLSKLIPNATYRYFNLMVLATDAATTNGAGTVTFPSASIYNHVSAPTFGTANFYGQFTADAAGTYTGWFESEPTGNAAFAVGNQVYQRIMLNDGAGGTTVVSRVTTPSSATVINYVSGAGANNGTGIRGTSMGTPKNIVVLYDNVSGTGRPITAAPIEADGYTVSNYPSFYTTSVDGAAGAWGTIIPNTLPNGIRRIEQRDVTTGVLVNCPSVSPNGVWGVSPSTVSTVNPSTGTTEIVLSLAQAPLNSTASTWLGINDYWFNANNWSCGVPNGSSTDVVIPSTAAVMPKLYGSITLRNIDLQGSSTIDLSTSTLTLAGAVSGTGTIKGSDLSGLTISGAAGTLNFTSGSRKLKTLTLNTGATATLGTALDITSANTGGTLTVASGATLTTGGNLTLKSSVTGTASVGTSAGTISGDVTVERYIPQNAFRAWRMLAVPTKGTQTIKEAWQENQSALANGNPGYGTILTSQSGGNGYDQATQGNSLLTYNSGTNAWVPVNSTFNTIQTTGGYMIYIRGDRSVLPTPGQSNPGQTTLRTTGTLYQGTQTAISASAGQTVLVGNIYPSAVDFTSLVRSAGVNSFTVWDPKLQGSYNLGGFQSFAAPLWEPSVGGGSYGSSPNTRIESGQAFFINPASGGSVQFVETAKVTGSKNVFRGADNSTTTYVQFKAKLYAVNSSGTALADGNSVLYDSAYSSAVDNNDVIKVNNFGENFGILSHSYVLAFEARQPVTSGDTLQYKTWNLKQQQYRLQLIPVNFDTAMLQAFLEDRVLNTTTPVSLGDTTEITFNGTTDTSLAAQTRFRIVYKLKSVMPVSFTSITAQKVNSNVKVEWTVAQEQNIRFYEVERSANGREFSKLGAITARGNSAGNLSYNWLDERPFKGVNYYRVKSVGAAGDVQYTSIVKVAMGDVNADFVITPNPVTGNNFSIQFVNQPEGVYHVRVLNAAGQVLYKKAVAHTTSDVHDVTLPQGTVSGMYQAELTTPTGAREVRKIVINKAK